LSKATTGLAAEINPLFLAVITKPNCRYEPKEAWVVNLELEESLTIGNTMVRFFPFQECVKKVGFF